MQLSRLLARRYPRIQISRIWIPQICRLENRQIEVIKDLGWVKNCRLERLENPKSIASVSRLNERKMFSSTHSRTQLGGADMQARLLIIFFSRGSRRFLAIILTQHWQCYTVDSTASAFRRFKSIAGSVSCSTISQCGANQWPSRTDPRLIISSCYHQVDRVVWQWIRTSSSHFSEVTFAMHQRICSTAVHSRLHDQDSFGRFDHRTLLTNLSRLPMGVVHRGGGANAMMVLPFSWIITVPIKGCSDIENGR